MVNPMETVAAKLPKSLVDAVDGIVAAGAFPNRSEVIRVAVREYLEADVRRASFSGDDRTRGAERKRLQQALRQLAKDPRYLNRFVALHKGQVVDEDDALDPLVQRVLQREEQPIYVERVNEGGEPVRVRMPGGRVRLR